MKIRHVGRPTEYNKRKFVRLVHARKHGTCGHDDFLNYTIKYFLKSSNVRKAPIILSFGQKVFLVQTSSSSQSNFKKFQNSKLHTQKLLNLPLGLIGKTPVKEAAKQTNLIFFCLMKANKTSDVNDRSSLDRPLLLQLPGRIAVCNGSKLQRGGYP